MASLRKRGKIWYVRVRDESGRQREVKAGPDKSIANQMKRDLESKTQRIKAGVLDPREADAMEAERIPITKHVADYIQNPEARGACPGHLENVRKRLDWLLAETAITRLSQLPESRGLRLEGPTRFWTVRPDDQSLRHLLEIVLEVDLEGSTDPD
jgi:hypothetical protein